MADIKLVEKVDSREIITIDNLALHRYTSTGPIKVKLDKFSLKTISNNEPINDIVIMDDM